MKTSTKIVLWLICVVSLWGLVIFLENRISRLEDKLEQHLLEVEPTAMSEYIAELKAERDYFKEETELYAEWLVSCERYIEELEETNLK